MVKKFRRLEKSNRYFWSNLKNTFNPKGNIQQEKQRQTNITLYLLLGNKWVFIIPYCAKLVTAKVFLPLTSQNKAELKQASMLLKFLGHCQCRFVAVLQDPRTKLFLGQISLAQKQTIFGRAEFFSLNSRRRCCQVRLEGYFRSDLTQEHNLT